MVVSGQDIVGLINELTAKAQSTQNIANQISIVNIALAVAGQGPVPVLIARLVDIVSTTSTSFGQLTGTKPASVKSDQSAILEAVTTFVQVNQALLNILIGKAELVPNLNPFVGPPLAAVLRQLESVYDTLLFEIADLVPDKEAEATKQREALDVSLDKAITSWSGNIGV